MKALTYRELATIKAAAKDAHECLSLEHRRVFEETVTPEVVLALVEQISHHRALTFGAPSFLTPLQAAVWEWDREKFDSVVAELRTRQEEAS